MFSIVCRLGKCCGEMSWNKISNNVLEEEGDSNTVFIWLNITLCYLVVPFLPDLKKGICGTFGDVLERKMGTFCFCYFLLESKIFFLVSATWVYKFSSQVYVWISQRCSKYIFMRSCAMGAHSFEMNSQCSFLCGWFLFVVLNIVLKFCMKAASAGTSRGRINYLTIEMGMSSILGKCNTA